MTNQENMIQEFIAYVRDFYGVGGIYDMGATVDQITSATDKYTSMVGFNEEDSFSFCGDSLDREKVRDIMIETFGLVFPEGNIKGVTDHETGLTKFVINA
jgi:hypothetical protein